MTAPLHQPRIAPSAPPKTHTAVHLVVPRFWAQLLHTLQNWRGRGAEWVLVNVNTGEVKAGEPVRENKT